MGVFKLFKKKKFQVLALLCMMCAAPAFNSTQHWFLLVVVTGFLGSLFFSLYHLCLDVYLKNVNVGWLPAEFWFTAVTSFLYFTAFTAQLAEFSGMTSEEYQYWIDANISAGVSVSFKMNGVFFHMCEKTRSG